MKSAIYIIICSVAALVTNTDQNFHMKLVGRKLEVLCKDESLDLIDYIPLNITIVERLHINGCQPLPFLNLIPSNMNKTALQHLELNAVPSDPPLTEAHFINLRVTELKITGQQRLEPSPDFLNSLTTLTKMAVSNMVLPPLPITSRLEEISLSNGRSLAIGGCSELRDLKMQQWTVEEIQGGWLSNCKNVNSISMARVDGVTVYRVVRGATSIRSLTITQSTLVTLSADLLAGATYLRDLVITRSDLRSINESAFEDQRASLYAIDLSRNRLRGETTARAILDLSQLELLRLSNNPLSDFCDHFNTTGHTFSLRVVQLYLQEANIQRLCFYSWPSLELLMLPRNNITELTLTELPMMPMLFGIRVVVHLEYNPLRPPPDNRALFDALTENVREFQNRYQRMLIIVNSVLDCNCQYAWFAKALRDLRPYDGIKSFRCKHNFLVDEPPESLECDRLFKCEPCDCRRHWDDSTIEADCRNRSLLRVPRIPGAHALLAGNNSITAIHVDDFPVSLRVEDYSLLKCASGESLDRVSAFELCEASREWVTVVVAALGVMASLLATFTALYFRYSRVVRVFLHARGLLCVDDEADTNFRYDAFVSFAHEDADFAEELIARLEGESNGWRTCVHYRDWVPGELIPTQISLSVEQSRRTIVLLSRNFLASMWGMLEFRTAHALHEGRLRLVLVVLDDVLDERLDAEVRSYVRTNTYVRWDDPWFWDKLLYVMPPRRAPQQTPAYCRGYSEYIPLEDIGLSPAVDSRQSFISL